jgi:hypothetical protein
VQIDLAVEASIVKINSVQFLTPHAKLHKGGLALYFAGNHKIPYVYANWSSVSKFFSFVVILTEEKRAAKKHKWKNLLPDLEKSMASANPLF